MSYGWEWSVVTWWAPVLAKHPGAVRRETRARRVKQTNVWTSSDVVRHFSNDLSNEDVKDHLGLSRGYLHGYDYGALEGNVRPAVDAAKRTDVLEPFLRIQGKRCKLTELTGILQFCKWHCFVCGSHPKLCFLHLFSSLVTTHAASALSMQRALLGSRRWSCCLLNVTVECVDAQ